MMRMFALLAAAGCVAGLSTVASAGPSHVQANKPYRGPMMSGVDNPFTDNFDSYTSGSGIAGQGGWQLWDPTSYDAWVDNTVAASAPNSLRLDGESDVVRVVDHTSGQWRLTANTYFPSTNFTAHGMLIGLNTFPYTALNSWSVEITWDYITGTVYEYETPSVNTPILFDQWVPVKIEVDLDTDTFNAWYNNVQIVTNSPWSSNVAAGGAVRIQCWDFYAWGGGMDIIWFDDVVFEQVTGGCYANCDGSVMAPILNVDDFTCFINAFAAAQPLPHAQQVTDYANCDGSTTAPALNVDDFTCFINAFAAGCP